MTLPPLVARSRGPAVPIAPEPPRVPMPNDWAARYPEIERLYVHERRKLRFVMRYMEREHSFKATSTDFDVTRALSEQMYKKRFAKWGFQKNSRCSDKAVSTLATKDACPRLARRKYNSVVELISMPTILQLGHDDSLKLSFLTSVRDWSVAFFEPVRPFGGDLACLTPTGQSRSEKVKQTSFTLELVSDLLDRGHGALAGRMVRKAFLLVEDILTLEGPALVWNLLEMMYRMVTLRHEQLFRMLLSHLIALVDRRMSKTHPLSAMLHNLRGYVSSLASGALTPGSSSLTSSHSSPLHPSIVGNGTTTSSHPLQFSHIISPLLEEAWILNAEIVFNHFDPRFFQLYFQLHWESCSIGLPSAIIGIAKQWLSHIDAQQMYSAITDTHIADDVVGNTLVEEDRMIQSLLAPRTDASPPLDYEMLRATSVAALLENGNPILSKELDLNSETASILRILPALIKARMLEQPAIIIDRSSKASSETTMVSRSQAGNMACVVRALMELNVPHGSDRMEAFPGADERIGSIIALREYAYSEIDPQVICEMSLLEDALAVAGKHDKAQAVGQSMIRRIERYTQDVLLDAV